MSVLQAMDDKTHIEFPNIYLSLNKRDSLSNVCLKKIEGIICIAKSFFKISVYGIIINHEGKHIKFSLFISSELSDRQKKNDFMRYLIDGFILKCC